MGDLRQAIDNFDLERFVEGHGGEEHQQGEWTVLCPWCGRFKLVVNMRRRSWHCWRCQQYEMRWTGDRYRRVAVAGAGGVIQLVMALDRIARMEAEAKILTGNVRRPGELVRVDVGDLDRPLPVVGNAPPIAPPPGCEAFSGPHPYLDLRGITMADVRAFGLTWCTWGRYANRLIFPVFECGALVYWQARAMWQGGGKDFVKALNPPRSLGGVTSAEVLFNYDQAIAAGGNLVCLVEGPVDAVHVGHDAVATFGKQITPTQIAKLLRGGVKHVDLLWDADAQNDAQVAAQQLAKWFVVRVARLPHGDPGEWPREALRDIRGRAEEVRSVSRLAQI